MAFASVITLKNTIENILNSSHISLDYNSRVILVFAYLDLKCLQRALETLDSSSNSSRRKRVNDLDDQIREAVSEFEDLLESHLSNQLLSQSEESNGDENYHPLSFSVDLQDLEQDVNSFVQTSRKMEEAYTKELDKPLPAEDDDDAAVSSNIDFGVKMVGLSDELTDIKDYLLRKMRPDDFSVFAMVGIVGTGRRFIAKTIFEELYVGQEQSLDCGAWVTIGPNYQRNEILVRILRQIVDDDDDIAKLLISEGDEKNIGEHLYTNLKGRRYMIVLDDICDTQIWDLLRCSFPEQNNGSLVLITTSFKEIAVFANSFFIDETSAFDEVYSWDVLRLAMFGVGWCPPELEETGKKIAENCKGLRIALAKVILFLMKAEKTPEYWNKLAAEKDNSVFMVVDEISEMSKIEEDLRLSCLFLEDYESLVSTQMATVMVDFSGSITEAKNKKLFPKRLFPKMEIISITGMVGIGKTTFVKEIFEHQSILHHFDHRVWVTLGPNYQSEEVWVDILSQIYPDIDKMHMKGDEKLVKVLCEHLSCSRCLIVLDDLWNKEPLHYLKKLMPNIKGIALVTTRLEEVARFGKHDTIFNMRLLNKEESWCLLRQKVFAKGLCPFELEKAGRKISENCEGLPLLILTVANLLCKVERTPEYWNKVALDKQNSLFKDAHDAISKALLPSYMSLPQHLKACFLYMGVFPQNCETSTSKLITLWAAEGFLEPNPSITVRDFAAKCLLELFERGLVMVCQKRFNLVAKTWSLHSVFWHLCNNEAMKNKFFHALDTDVSSSIEGIKGQRRLCIRNSISFGIKHVHNLMASISTARSLLCTGPPHQYPIPIYLGLRLLRVLDALTIRFYEFPIELLKLIHLRYLALTCNGQLPASISKLRNLEYLIVRRHLSIKSCEDLLYLPMQIWDMKEFKHLQIMGSNLPNPVCCAGLPNLIILYVSALGCTKRVLKRIPNLKRLEIRIELGPDDSDNPLRCLNRISRLRKLESLKCIIVNPELKPEVAAPPFPRSMFPSSLRKLSLNGLGYPWEYMSIIGSLPNLEVLKLRCYAFQGPVWKTDGFSFCKLRFLLIEDTDLVRWELKGFSFLELKCLNIKHCYYLEVLPSRYFNVETIEAVDCNPVAMTWVKMQMQEKNLQERYTGDAFHTHYVDCSWEPQVITSNLVQKELDAGP